MKVLAKPAAKVQPKPAAKVQPKVQTPMTIPLLGLEQKKKEQV
jgi:hypothetical protein